MKILVMLKMQFITGMGTTLMVIAYELVTHSLFTFTSTSEYLRLSIYLCCFFNIFS